MTRIPLSALLGLILTGGFFFIAIFAQFIAPYEMDELVGGVWDPISAQHWLGTDSIGRDLLTRMIFGAQVTIFVATCSTILSFVTGSVLGFLAATAGGWVDQALSRFVDLMMAIPTLILSLVILTAVDVTMINLILVMGLLDATRVFRLSRAVAVDLTVKDYGQAPRPRG